MSAGRAPVVVWRGPGRPHPDADYATALVRELDRCGVAHVVADLRELSVRPDLTAAPAHVITGGDTSILDRPAWGEDALAAFDALVRRAAAGDARLVGVCFGAQLIAASVPGGHVVGRRAIRTGLVEVHATGEGRPGHVSAAFHYEELAPALADDEDVQVTYDLPEGELLGFRLGTGAFGVQFHPELTPAEIRLVIDANEQLLRERGLEPAVAHASVDALEARWTPALFAECVVAPLDR